MRAQQKNYLKTRKHNKIAESAKTNNKNPGPAPTREEIRYIQNGMIYLLETVENSLDFELSTFQCYTRFYQSEYLFLCVLSRQIEIGYSLLLKAVSLSKTLANERKNCRAYWRCKE